MVNSSIKSPFIEWFLSAIAYLQNFVVVNFLIGFLFDSYRRIQWEKLDKFKDQPALSEVMQDIDMTQKLPKNVLKKATIKAMKNENIRGRLSANEDLGT